MTKDYDGQDSVSLHNVPGAAMTEDAHSVALVPYD